MTETEKRTQVRMPTNVHQWLTARAARNNRSMNGELIDILEKAKEAEQAYYTACMESGVKP